MKLMPVGTAGGRNITQTKGSTIIKTDTKPYLMNKGGKRPMYTKPLTQNKRNLITLNSRLLLRPQELSIHPNSSLSPNAAHLAADQIRQKFGIMTTRKISGLKAPTKQQHVEVSFK